MESSDNPLRDGSYRGCMYYMMAVLILIIMVCFLCSCRTVYVPVETVRTEYVVRTDTFTQKDSVLLHDSVYIHSKGDTVWYEKWHTKYRDKIVTKVVVDSFIKTDSTQVPYPVERKLTRWEKIKMDAGGIAIVITLFVILFIFVWCLTKLKRCGISFH